MFAPKMILVPTDFSEYSDRALAAAVDIAKQHNAPIELLHVIGIVQTCAVDYCFERQIIEQLEKNSMDSSKDLMAKQVGRIPGASSVAISTAIRKGVPAEEILVEQKEKKADLIVIASHGTTGLLHYLMGSVAEKVTRGAACPVLVVRK